MAKLDSSSNYVDVDLTFKSHPVKKDLIVNKGEIAVTKALKNLILYNHYEKPFMPEYGSNIKAMLFEPISPFTANSLKTEIEMCIKNFEPRVKINDITVLALYDYNSYQVTIEYYIENMIEPYTASFILNKLR